MNFVTVVRTDNSGLEFGKFEDLIFQYLLYVVECECSITDPISGPTYLCVCVARSETLVMNK